LKIAHVIGKAVWDQGGDIRDVISIGKLVRKNDGPEEVEQILATMSKYGEINNNHSNRTSGSDSKNFETKSGSELRQLRECPYILVLLIECATDSVSVFWLHTYFKGSYRRLFWLHSISKDEGKKVFCDGVGVSAITVEILSR
jgi:hypothetical protein